MQKVIGYSSGTCVAMGVNYSNCRSGVVINCIINCWHLCSSLLWLVFTAYREAGTKNYIHGCSTLYLNSCCIISSWNYIRMYWTKIEILCQLKKEPQINAGLLIWKVTSSNLFLSPVKPIGSKSALLAASCISGNLRIKY